MKKTLLTFLLAGCLAANAQTVLLKGFDYAETAAPTGKEWESPEQLALNKEQPHAEAAHHHQQGVVGWP